MGDQQVIAQVEEQQKETRCCKAIQQGSPCIDMFVGGQLAFQVVDGKEQPGQQAENDAGRVQSPGGGICSSRNEDRADKTERDRNDLDSVEPFLEDQVTQDGGHCRGGEGQYSSDSRSVVL